MTVPRKTRRVKTALALLILTVAVFASAPSWADGRMSGGMPGMGGDSPMGMMPGSAKEPATEPMEGMDSQPAMAPAESSAATDVSPEAVPAALPTFAGTPDIYHMGATGFFLDHPEHIALTAQQRQLLQTIKGRAQKDQSGYQQQITTAENGVWSLTGTEQPDAVAIEQKIHEIEALRAKQRMAFIAAVGEAAKVLTDAQRKQLAGLAAPDMAGGAGSTTAGKMK